MFCFAKQKLLITSDNTAYPVSVFYKNLHPNSASFHFAELRIRRNVVQNRSLSLSGWLALCTMRRGFALLRFVARLHFVQAHDYRTTAVYPKCLSVSFAALQPLRIYRAALYEIALRQPFGTFI